MINIEDPAGMKEAKAWLKAMVEQLADTTVPWYIPRAETLYHLDKRSQIAWRISGTGDEETERVFVAIGWHVAMASEKN